MVSEMIMHAVVLFHVPIFIRTIIACTAYFDGFCYKSRTVAVSSTSTSLS